jgi:hypothetical protein
VPDRVHRAAPLARRAPPRRHHRAADRRAPHARAAARRRCRGRVRLRARGGLRRTHWRAAGGAPPLPPETRGPALSQYAPNKVDTSRPPPPPSLPYKVDTSRPSLRTNWTRNPLPSPTCRRRQPRSGRARPTCTAPPVPPRAAFPRTNWTRRVPRPVLTGHAASLTPRCPAPARPPPRPTCLTRARPRAQWCCGK